MSERRLRERLRGMPLPGETQARERAWAVVRAGLATRSASSRGRRPARLLAGLAALAATGVAVTAPGEAIGDWIADAVRPGREDARPALSRVPAGGRLLVVSARGPWVVERDGSRRLLGAYDDAAMSPRGLFVAVARGRQLTAVDPRGRPRWSLSRGARVRDPRWSHPDGERIAYRAGRGVRVVYGDGLLDRPAASRVAPVAPAWSPDGSHVLVYAHARGGVAAIGTDDGNRALWRTPRWGGVREVVWSPDARRLLVVAADAVRVLDRRGRLLRSLPLRPGRRAHGADWWPSSDSFAFLVSGAGGTRSEALRVRLAGGPPQTLFAGAGELADLQVSPDGRWLLLSWRDADQWLFVRVARGRERIVAISDVARQFDPGGLGAARFPRVAGWCCAS